MKISELRPDPNNLNKGTERGRYAIERSIRDYGFGRPIVADKNGVIIAGNHALEVAAELGYDDVEVVQTDGKKLIVHQRTDLESGEGRTRMLALADNRASEINLQFDAERLTALYEDEQAVTNFFSLDELAEFNQQLEEATPIGEVFEPDLNPTQGAGQAVTTDKIESEQERLTNNFATNVEPDLIEITCPCCDSTFTISRADLE